MKIKSLIIIGCLMACMVCPAVFAQEEYPVYEIFFGYSLLKPGEYDDMDEMKDELSWNVGPNGRLKSSGILEKGFSTSFTYNFASFAGLETSFRLNSGYILSVVDRGIGVESEEGFKRTDLALLAGPRFTFRSFSDSVTPFVYGLAGLSRDSISFAWDENYFGYFDSNSTRIKSHTSLGYAVGGGIDITLHENVALRAIKADYYRANHPARLLNEGENKLYNNISLSFGLVVRFGYK